MKTSNSAKPTIKPLLRGHSHQAAFFIALGACSMLLMKATSNTNFLAAAIYSLSLIALFGISAIYHRPTWKPLQRQWLRKLDHAAIYILIAGTSTPICLIALNTETGATVLKLVWMAALFGMFQSLFWSHAPKWISSILYIITGCLILPYFNEIQKDMPTRDAILILTGGGFYVFGAIVYALRKPNPYPLIFGYHEIFHLFVIFGALFHFLVIASLIR